MPAQHAQERPTPVPSPPRGRNRFRNRVRAGGGEPEAMRCHSPPPAREPRESGDSLARRGGVRGGGPFGMFNRGANVPTEWITISEISKISCRCTSAPGSWPGLGSGGHEARWHRFGSIRSCGLLVCYPSIQIVIRFLKAPPAFGTGNDQAAHLHDIRSVGQRGRGVDWALRRHSGCRGCADARRTADKNMPLLNLEWVEQIQL